jgi:hypothetical protein
MNSGLMWIYAAFWRLQRKRLRAPALWLTCAPLLGALAACNGHNDDRAALTASAARELAGAPPPQAANSITAFAAAPESNSANSTNAGEAALPPLAVRTPAKLPADGSPGIEPLVTPEIHTAD